MKHNVPSVKQGEVAISAKKEPQKVATPVVGADDVMQTLRKTDVSVGNVHSQPYPATKTAGVKIRGTGAATKGTMARGPLC